MANLSDLTLDTQQYVGVALNVFDEAKELNVLQGTPVNEKDGLKVGDFYIDGNVTYTDVFIIKDSVLHKVTVAHNDNVWYAQYNQMEFIWEEHK